MNPSDTDFDYGTFLVSPRSVYVHPGEYGLYADVSWTAPKAGVADVAAEFSGLSDTATVDVCVLVRGMAIFARDLNNSPTLHPRAVLMTKVVVEAGDIVEFGVGPGTDGLHYNDSTFVDLKITLSSQ
jgi:hypothetical protein